MMLRGINTFLIIAYLAISSFLSYGIMEEASDFKEFKTTYTKRLNMNENVFDPRDYFITGEYQKAEKTAELFLIKSEEAKAQMVLYAWIIAIVTLIFVLYAFIYGEIKKQWKFLGWSVVVASFVFLAVGITVPMLEIAAYLDGLHIPIKAGLADVSETLGNIFPDFKIDTSADFEGKIYAFHQSKSILDLIDILFTSKNYTVGIAILFFSVIFPLLKLLFSSLFLLSKKARQRKLLVNVISYIGKFSMADVFVVATILAYLAFENMNPGVTVDAKTLVGLHLFLVYCMLSIIVFFVIKKLQKEDQKNYLK